MNQVFDPDQPWIGVFTYAARDQDYWSKFVIRPAQTFLARGGSGKRMPREVAEDAHMSNGAAMALNKGDSLPGEGTSRNARKRRREKVIREQAKKQKEAEAAASSAAKSGPPKGGNGRGEHPRKFGKFFVTDREGNEICYKHAKGGSAACPDPCPDGRTHCCQICLGAHTNSTCPKSGGKGKPSK